MEQGPKRATEDSFRVQNYNVTLKKPAEFALTAVYGYGRSRSKQLAASVGIFGHYPLYRMRESQREYIRRELNAACIAYDSPGQSAGAALQKEVGLNIQRLKEIGCYRFYMTWYKNKKDTVGKRSSWMKKWKGDEAQCLKDVVADIEAKLEEGWCA